MPVGDVAHGYTFFKDTKDQLFHCRKKDLKTCWGPYVKMVMPSA